MKKCPFDLGTMVHIRHFRTAGRADVEAVDDARADRLDRCVADVETHFGERCGDSVQQPDRVRTAHFDDGGVAARLVDEDDGRRQHGRRGRSPT